MWHGTKRLGIAGIVCRSSQAWLPRKERVRSSLHPILGLKVVPFGTIDLTNPGAVSFFTQIIQCNMLRVGVGCGPNGTTLLGPSKYSTYGWMSDFAEYIPFDSILHSGDPIKVHNKFPEMWAQTNRIAVNAAGFDGMSAFFSRSSALRSPLYSQLFWMGDQLTTFDAYDGLHSALIGMLSGGIVGHALSHSDIGGYTMVDECLVDGKMCYKILRSKELFAALDGNVSI